MSLQVTHIFDKHTARRYPAIRSMLTIYFNREHDDFGSTLEEIIDSYLDYSVLTRAETAAEITALLNITDEDALNTLMNHIADGRFQPEPWGEIWRSLLEKVDARLKQ
ncbi:hypothetical protein RJ498_000998 [Pluralibacter gergoviae]